MAQEDQQADIIIQDSVLIPTLRMEVSQLQESNLLLRAAVNQLKAERDELRTMLDASAKALENRAQRRATTKKKGSPRG